MRAKSICYTGTIEHGAIKTLIYAKPFYPFTIFQKDGPPYNITSRENCWVSPFGVYIVQGDPPLLDIVDPDLLEKVRTHFEISRDGQQLGNKVVKEPGVEATPNALTVKKVGNQIGVNDLIEQLREIKEQSGLSEFELAKQIGVVPQVVKYWLKGLINPQRRSQEKIKKFLRDRQNFSAPQSDGTTVPQLLSTAELPQKSPSEPRNRTS